MTERYGYSIAEELIFDIYCQFGLWEDAQEHLKAWKRSKRWLDDNGEFIPNAENFLDPGKGYMKNKPAPANQGSNASVWGSAQLGEAEIGVIHRMLSEPDPGDTPDEEV